MTKINTPQMPQTEYPTQLVKLVRRWNKANDSNEGTEAQEARFEKAEAALNDYVARNADKLPDSIDPLASHIDWINAVDPVLEMEDLLGYMTEAAKMGVEYEAHRAAYDRLMANWR